MEEQKVGCAPRCLVTGATGAVGVGLVNKLLKRGHPVRILTRDPVDPNLFVGKVEITTGDLRDKTVLARCVKNQDWIFHFAAKLHINNPGKDLAQEYVAINRIATENLVEIAAQNRVRKFVYASTINVYGASDGIAVFDETSPPNPVGIYAETKLAGEKAVLQFDNGTVLRLAAVYGSRMKGNYVRLLRAIKRNRFLFVGTGANRRTLIHQQDAAEAAIALAEKAVGKTVYNATDGSLHRFDQIVAAMAWALNKNAPRLRVPLFAVQNLVKLSERVCQTLKIGSRLDRQLLDKLLEDAAVSGAKINRELNFVPQFDLKKGWAETIANQFER